MKILITGGAGFVGSSLARYFAAEPEKHSITVIDNLKRRGSELNLSDFRKLGVEFVHGDIRSEADLMSLNGDFDLLVEASAEPSVLAGVNGSPNYVIQTNLVGTLNCLEFARQRCKKFIFLSTSRVYSLAPLRGVKLDEEKERFVIAKTQDAPGISEHGISEDFPTSTARSLYGTTKLASEYMIQEYCEQYGLSAIINRCGVLAGPGQFGKVDQGVYTLWVLNHFFQQPLRYTGFGGTGKQVRDVMHPHDLYRLISLQIPWMDKGRCDVFNAGGGVEGSVSLREMTAICQKVTGKTVPIEQSKDSHSVDIPLYISDNRKAERVLGWRPTTSVPKIMMETVEWISGKQDTLKELQGLGLRANTFGR